MGINLSVANLEAYALSRGITTSYNSMSQAEKTMLRYNYILSATGDAQGDFARTSGTWANQVRLLTLNFQSLAAVLGQGIIAGILPAIQALNAFISKLMQAANAFRNFMYVLMGKKLKGSTSGIVNDLAGLEDTSTDLSGLQNAGDDASSGLDNATNSAKALKKALSVLPFDELNQLTDNSDNTGTTSSKKGSSGLGNLAGGLSGLQDSIDDALNTEETPINKWASKIRKAFLKHDWESIGKTIADMLNIGIQKIYDVINWKKVGPKITQFTDAFTRAFNSLVDNINWNLIGRTLGSGIDTIAHTTNQLLEGINWKNLGSKFANGVTGLTREVDWNNFGNMLGNGFMTGWNIFSGFVSNLKYDEIGQAIGNSLNGIFENINFSEIAGALTTGINGAFEALANFTATFNWGDFTNNLGSGISKFIADMDWKENGAALGSFLSHLCKALKESLTPDTFHDLGVGIGEFLGELPWGELLSTAADLLIGGFANTLGGLFDGLEEKHPISGHIIEGLTAAFIAVKVADITGIGKLVGKLISRIGEKIVAEKNAELIASKLSEILGQGTSGTAEVLEDLGEAAGSSSGKFASLAGELAPFVGAAGLCATLAVGIGEVATKVSSLIDSANGGNGTITDFGYTVDKLISIMQDSNTITADQKNELFLLKEQLEDTNASAGEYGTALADAMAKGKVSSDDLQSAVSQLKVEMNLTEDETEMLTSLLEQMGQKTDEMATKTSDSATLSKKQWESMKDSLLDLYTQGVIPLDDQLTQLSGTLQSQESAGATAETAYNKLEKEMKNMGMTNEDISTVLSTLFPEATMAVKTAVDTNIVGAQEKISSSMATAKADVEDATSSMASSADTNAGSIKKNIDDSFKEVSKSSETEWGDSYNSVKEALRDMESGTLSSMKNIMGYIQSYWKSVVLDTNSTWELMSRKADKELSKIKETVKSVSSNISASLSELITKIRTSFSEMYTIGHNAAQSLRDGMKSVTMPTLSYYISEWRTHDLGNGKTSSTPIYTPNWFAKGGLFNQASVIGVGEAGQEAVLPLTDHKVMKNIADSIMSGYDGNIGLSKEELAAAVERGVVTAMMNNGGFGGSSPKYIMNSIKVNERELARIVTKAQNNTEYRMNPSPAY